MDLKFIKQTVTSVGQGNIRGELVNEEYECPCGKGVVEFENDSVTGFKIKNINCSCTECNEKYIFSRGTAIKK